MTDTAVMLCKGRGHIIDWVNDRFRVTVGWDPCGLPAREAFPGYPGEHAMMDRVLVSGVDDECLSWVGGVRGLFVVMPRLVHGRIVGVKTGWKPVPVPQLVG